MVIDDHVAGVISASPPKKNPKTLVRVMRKAEKSPIRRFFGRIKHMIKAIIFDHDGVIIDNQPFQKRAWKQISKEYNIEISDEDLGSKIRGRPIIICLRNLFGDRFSEKKLQEIANRKEEIYKQIFRKNFKVVKGIVSFLKELQKEKITTAVATSTTKDLLDFTLDCLDIRKYFNVIVTSNESVKGKPDPEIYLLTAKKLGVSPEDCVVFEDSFSGVESARRAGMKVILVATTHQKNEFEKVDLAINDFTEISISKITKL